MKPNRIILIRHGESEGNVNKHKYETSPDYTLELTAAGIAQAQNAGVQLQKIVGNESLFFYVSPMWRTRSTFENVSKVFNKNNISYREDPRIREQEWGHLRNAEVNKDIRNERDAYGTFYFRIPDGESAADVYDRVSDFLGTLQRDFEKDDFPQNTVIVTHGMSIRLFLMRWFHWTVEEFEALANPENCEIIVLEKTEEGKYKLASNITRYDTPWHEYQRPIQL